MPWKVTDVERHKKGLTKEQKRKWVKIANAVLERDGDEGKAIRIANKKCCENIENNFDRTYKRLMEEVEGCDINEFVKYYIEAAFFTEYEELPEKDQTDISEESLKKIKEDCEKFLSKVKEAVITLSNCEYAGHDFWFTRNGHGVGFWDRPEIYGEEESEKLTEISKEFGECNVYIGDDGKVYFQ